MEGLLLHNKKQSGVLLEAGIQKAKNGWVHILVAFACKSQVNMCSVLNNSYLSIANHCILNKFHEHKACTNTE